MNQRPRITLERSTTDTLMEIAGWVVTVGVWVLIAVNYAHLPDRIPTHFDAAGQPDAFGHKATILILPVVSTVLFLGLTLLNNYPHVFNYPTTITPDNALDAYTKATRLLRYLKLVVVFIFGMIAFKTIHTANGNAEGLGVWFLPVVLGLIFIPLVNYVLKSKIT
jgi:uncharacterized membrane protein